ncbi:sugar transferase [Demetria terragena]|uniref:sugar transferase n=1 Tax=Demetria terragena TaxID=63959 RepID=UPI00037F3F35|nr:sugar transferase [Demetria terragena]
MQHMGLRRPGDSTHEGLDADAAIPQSAPRPAPQWIPRYRRAAVVLDALAAMAAVCAAHVASVALGMPSPVPAGSNLLLLLAPVVWIASLALSRAYDQRHLGDGPSEYGTMPQAAVRLLAAGAVVGAPFLGHLPRWGTLLVLIGLPVAVTLSLVLRYLLRQSLHRARSQHGRAMQRTVVLGCQESVSELVTEFRRESTRGFLAVGSCTPTADPLPGLPFGGLLHSPLPTIDAAQADVVVVAHPSGLDSTALRRLSWALEERGVELMVAPGITEVAGPRLSIRPSASLALLHVESPASSGGALVGKVIFDRIVAFALGLILLPLFIIVALCVKVDSKGPILFRQKRIGARGEPFSMVKFRSMSTDAEARLADLQRAKNDGSGPLFKHRHDPRVTRIGRILRRYSLDELPQLWNVLTGDMSLVGPRPPLPSEVATYEPDAVRRLRVRPGLTGLWQVSGRSDLSWDESLRLDLRYVDNWSVMFDLQILWRTVRAVVRGHGAY